MFNRDILQKLPKTFLIDTILIKLIEGFIGTSKLAFLKSDGSYKIVNESLGHWEDDVWYSNSSYEDTIRCYGGYSGYGFGNDYWKEPTKVGKYKDNKSRDITLSPLPNLKCEWCGDRVNSLTEVDIADYYGGDSETLLKICDYCVEYEEDLERTEQEIYDDSISIKRLS